MRGRDDSAVGQQGWRWRWRRRLHGTRRQRQCRTRFRRVRLHGRLRVMWRGHSQSVGHGQASRHRKGLITLRLGEVMHGRLRSGVDVGGATTHSSDNLHTENRGPSIEQTVHRHSYVRGGVRICCGKSVKEIDAKGCNVRAANIFNNRV